MRKQPHIAAFFWALLATSWVLGSAASAEEVTLRLDTEGEYNSNILGSANREIDSFVARIGPEIDIKDPYGRLTYSLRYAADFMWYANAQNIDGFEQSLSLNGSYALSRQTTLSVKESFRDLSNVRFAVGDEVDLADTLDGGRDRFRRNVFSASLNHNFSRRVSARLTVNNEQIDYANDHFHTDSTFMGAEGSLSYMLTRQDSLGVGGGFTYQKFEAAGSSLASQGKVWNSYLSWVHRFESDMKFTIQGGPSFISTESSGRVRTARFLVIPVGGGINSVKTNPCTQPSPEYAGGLYENSCADRLTTATGRRTNIPLLGADTSQSRVTFFGKVSLVRNVGDWELRLSYIRRQSGAAGDQGTSALDRAFWSVNYDLNRLWSFYLSSGWSRRERLSRRSLIDQFIVVPSVGLANPRVAATTRMSRTRESSNSQYNIIVQTKRRLTKHLDARASFAYRHQIRKRPAAVGLRANYYIFRVALSYEFDPIRF